jgi:hypothetical protein
MGFLSGKRIFGDLGGFLISVEGSMESSLGVGLMDAVRDGCCDRTQYALFHRLRVPLGVRPDR